MALPPQSLCSDRISILPTTAKLVPLEGRMVVIIYTQRPFYRHIISMRKANAREQLRFRRHFT